MSIAAPIVGLPGFGTARTASNRVIFRDGQITGWLSQGKVINGTLSRDPSNTGNIDVLRAGLLMGKITATGLYAPSVLGVTSAALTNTGTTVSASAAVVTELVRRLGSSGTFKLVGPPAASGVVRTSTLTYSAASGTSITVTAAGVNEVQTLTFGAAATGGAYRFRVPLANGSMVTTGSITWDATDATLLGNINAALDTATGVVGGIVATGAAPDTALTFTFSGVGYLSSPQPTETISVVTFPTSGTTATTVRTTTGVSGAFVIGSLICPVDGSENPVTLVPSGSGLKVTDLDGTSVDRDFPMMPLAGVLLTANFLPAYPSDASLKIWLKETLSTLSAGKYAFDDEF